MKIMIGKYEATIYPERGGYTGAISCGFDASGRLGQGQARGPDQGTGQGASARGR